MIVDTRAPQVAEVRLRAGRVEIEWAEEVDPQSANTTVTIDGAQTGWELLPDRYTLRSILGVSPLAHTVAITPGITDLSGKGSLLPLTVELPAGAADRLGYRRADPTEIPTSSAANLYGFHGHEIDPATGLVYMRNRWYDPDMGRFVTADPLGYVDGPGTYQIAGGDPINKSDPLGLYAEGGHYYTTLLLALRVGFSPQDSFALAVGAQAPDEIAAFDAKETFLAARGASAFHPWNSSEENRHMITTHRAHHALTGGVAVLESDRAVESVLASTSLLHAGIQIHRLGDSFSHRREDNTMFLYEAGNGHLFDRTSPDAIQRRPDLYMEYARALLSALKVFAGNRGLPPSQLANTAGLAEIARRPSSLVTRWYKWEGSEDGSLDDLAIEALRKLILETARERGVEDEVRRLLSYKPENSSADGMTAEDLDRQLRAAVGDARTPAGVAELQPAGGN
ncbi:MAG: RHS repeat-associated core domain-containing protein [Thermoanaerobaculia bacterium]|nr:MAG: RHS repeat-associated core domain-containing protein [Thermoanaerobaculia bacterium]